MTKKLFSLLILLAMFYSQKGSSQCATGALYQGAAAPTAGCTIVSGTTCAFNNEYTRFFGLTIGETYTVGNCTSYTGTDGGAAGTDLTVRNGGTGSGSVVGFVSTSSAGACYTFVAADDTVTVQVNDPGCVSSSNCNKIVIVCESCPQTTCPAPTTLSSSGLTAASATLNWVAPALCTPTDYEVEYGPTGFTQGTGTVVAVSGATTTTISGLTPSTTYQFYVRSDCGGGLFSSWVGPTSFTTQATCAAQSALSVSSVTNATATITWTDNNSPTIGAYQVEYGLTGFTQGTGTLVSTGSIPYTITSLTAQTTYQVYVRANCGGGDYSAWLGPVSFTTACDTYTPTYLQDFASFTGLNAPTFCWSEAVGLLAAPTTFTSTTSSAWTSDGFGNNGTTGAARLNIWSTTPKEWLISPSFDLSGGPWQMEFDLALTPFSTTASATLGADDLFAVLVSTDNGVTWTSANILQSWDSTTPISNTGDHIIIDLSAYSGTVKFAFYGQSTVSNTDNNVYVDNFAINPLALCNAPSSLTASNITNTSADLSWTANSGETLWNVEWGPTGFTPGSGTLVSGVSNPHTISGLTGNTTYDFYTQADCGAGGTSSWSTIGTFTTACDAVTAPYTENFDVDGLPTCWTNSGPEAWLYSNVTESTADYGANSIDDATGNGGYFAMVDGSGSGTNTGITLTSPYIDVSGLTTPSLSFSLFSNNVDDAALNLFSVEVWDGAAWNTVYSNQSNLGSSWTNIVVDLSTLNITGDIQVRFIVDEDSSLGLAYYNDILLDNVVIDELPTCIAPIVSISNITDASADVNWIDGGSGATLFNLEWGVAGFTQGTGTLLTGLTTSPESLVGLTSCTEYDVYVQADCGANGTSSWAYISFTTAAPAALDCSAAIALSCATPVTATLEGNCSILDFNTTTGNASASCGWSTPGAELIYSFTAPYDGNYELEILSASPTGYIDYFYKDASLGCDNLNWNCIDDELGSAAIAGTMALIGGTEYYILLDAEGTTLRSHTFQINCPPACAATLSIETNDEGDYAASVIMEADDLVASNMVTPGTAVAIVYDGGNSVTLVDGSVTGDTNGFEAIPTADGYFLATVGDGCTTIGSYKEASDDQIQAFEQAIENRTAQEDALSLSAAPNPTNGITTLSFQSTQATEALIDVFNIQGQRIVSLYKDELNANQLYQLKMNTNDLVNGIYFVRLVSSNGEVQNLKLMVQH
ncbi:MAG: fibronectin type III domain-containing protein [Chitinophagales bacterium]|nr:fibronectin type III domain-containing protein [Chitinophagales bacterium]